MFSLASLSQIEVSFSLESICADVDLEYLAHHMDDYHGMKVKTEGIVKFVFEIEFKGGAGFPPACDLVHFHASRAGWKACATYFSTP